MRGMNRVMLIGNLGGDPQIRYTKKGTPVVNLNVATNHVYKNENGAAAEQTEWHKVVVWGKQAEACQAYLTKGRQIYAEGRLATRTWNDREGNEKKTVEIMAQDVRFLGGRRTE